MMTSDRTRFERTVRETFKGRTLVVADQRYTFPKFE